MPKGTNQKLKLIYLIRILQDGTDDEHSLTMPEIIGALAAYGISAERKSIYADFETLRDLGIDVIKEKCGKTCGYHIGNRRFELAELKLLVDIIQSSKFVTAKKSRELIGKLEGFASRYEAGQLQRQVYVAGRAKTMNESIYYNVDMLHTAIAENRRIAFQYFQWNVKKEMELRRDGQFYEVSPWALSWEDENYYLIGYDAGVGQIRHYRVDKMLRIRMIDGQREGKSYFEQFDVAAYTRKSFGMYGGEETTVTIEFENSLAGVVIDRFGKDISLIPSDEAHFRIHVAVAVSGPFFGWLFALGGGARIIGPEAVVSQMREALERTGNRYLTR